METIDLKSEMRDVVGKHVKYLREEGWVPAVLYGRGLDTMSLKVRSKTLERVLNRAGTHQLISLQVGEDGTPRKILARDVQRDPIRRNCIHVDFYVVRMDEKVTAQVPLIFEGYAPAIDQGGVLTQGLDELEIECLPDDLISDIPVSVESLLEFNDTILVSDLNVPENITILSEPESMVAKIEPPRLLEEEEEEEDELAPISMEPEVLTAAKDRDEE